jgi:hypothetical protein
MLCVTCIDAVTESDYRDYVQLSVYLRYHSVPIRYGRGLQASQVSNSQNLFSDALTFAIFMDLYIRHDIDYIHEMP